MFYNPFIYIFLFIFTAPLYAEVYKCDDKGTIHYSTTPCNNSLIDLELGDESIADELVQEELFFAPTYPAWVHGWNKTKDLKLERFFEIEYEPNKPNEADKLTHINKQKLTNLPQSMSVQRFAVSVEDIIESICKNAIIYQPSSPSWLPEKVFYGQYACSYRRDTKQGELGYYKIMRGENSIYMMAIIWGVTPFTITEGEPLAILEDKLQKQKISVAKKYLQEDVKLCKAGICL
jgi:hypothetical protein